MKIILLILSLVYFQHLFALNFSPSLIPKGVDTVMTEQQRAEVFIASKIIRQNNNDKKGRLLGFTNLGNGDSWFDLYSNLTLYGVNVATKEYLGSWPLTRWTHEYIPTELTQRLQQNTYESKPNAWLSIAKPPYYFQGCLHHTPLRYGDIDNNNSDELVIFGNQDLIIFSPQSQQVIFQFRWFNERYSGYFDEFLDQEIIYENTPENADTPQYKDAYSLGGLYAGQRFYAKMYIGEFNKNTSPDILVWHKAYESNLIPDTPGFSKQSDHFIHYELIITEVNGQQPTGEYLPQTTDQTTIQQWLTANNHTWQSGYPNQTECEGQTGHIPELIDPLLNDPEVLQ